MRPIARSSGWMGRMTSDSINVRRLQLLSLDDSQIMPFGGDPVPTAFPESDMGNGREVSLSNDRVTARRFLAVTCQTGTGTFL
jgi:hypothetical protein